VRGHRLRLGRQALLAHQQFEIACGKLNDDDGIHRAVLMNIVDDERRLTRVEGACYASAPTEYEAVSNNDCYFNFEVNRGQHRGSGILSFFWNHDYYHRLMRKPRT
jgi:hypothetical protein